jgi:tetratricopeptide (TPR) repeat protein
MGIRGCPGRGARWLRNAVPAPLALLLWFGPGGSAHAQNDYSAWAQTAENASVCTDQSQPLSRRVSSCSQVIDQGGIANVDIAKIYLSLGQAFQESADDQGALRNFNAAIKADPKHEQSWVARANFYASKANFPRALEDYNAALKVNPTDPMVYDNRGNTLNAMGDRDTAIADFGRAIALDPQDWIAYSNRATLRLAAGEPSLAITDLSEVIRAEPGNGMAAYNRGTAYERSGQIDEALEDYRQAAHLLPAFAPASAAIGRLLKNKDPDEALAQLSAAIALDAKSPALRSRGTLYLALGRYDDALRDFDRVIADNGSDSIAYLDKGVAEEKMGNFTGAIRDYSRSIELAPAAATYVDRGGAFMQMQQAQQAQADFRSALVLEPANVPALLGQAQVSYARKSMNETLVDYSQVLEVDPKNATAYFKRGNVHFDLREYAAAISDYSASLRLDPNQPVVLFNRSLAATRMGRLEEAAGDRQRALELDPQVADGEERLQKK